MFYSTSPENFRKHKTSTSKLNFSRTPPQKKLTSFVFRACRSLTARGGDTWTVADGDGADRAIGILVERPDLVGAALWLTPLCRDLVPVPGFPLNAPAVSFPWYLCPPPCASAGEKNQASGWMFQDAKIWNIQPGAWNSLLRKRSFTHSENNSADQEEEEVDPRGKRFAGKPMDDPTVKLTVAMALHIRLGELSPLSHVCSLDGVDPGCKQTSLPNLLAPSN